MQVLAKGLFEIGPEPRLIGGRRHADGRIVFPMPVGAQAALHDPTPLSREGTLWSFTVQRFRPKTPPYAGAEDEGGFTPYAVGYVELAGEVIVEGRIRTADPDALKIGEPMRLVLEPFATADRGEVLSYAFAPIRELVP
jgi:uncharacterized OB-fold protein